MELSSENMWPEPELVENRHNLRIYTSCASDPGVFCDRSGKHGGYLNLRIIVSVFHSAPCSKIKDTGVLARPLYENLQNLHLLN